MGLLCTSILKSTVPRFFHGFLQHGLCVASCLAFAQTKTFSFLWVFVYGFWSPLSQKSCSLPWGSSSSATGTAPWGSCLPETDLTPSCHCIWQSPKPSQQICVENGYFLPFQVCLCFSAMVSSSNLISSSYLLFLFPSLLVFLFLINCWFFTLFYYYLFLTGGKRLVEPLEEMTHSRMFSFKWSQSKTSMKSLKQKFQPLYSRESWRPWKYLQEIFLRHPKGLQSPNGWNASSPSKDEAEDL